MAAIQNVDCCTPMLVEGPLKKKNVPEKNVDSTTSKGQHSHYLREAKTRETNINNIVPGIQDL